MYTEDNARSQKMRVLDVVARVRETTMKKGKDQLRSQLTDRLVSHPRHFTHISCPHSQFNSNLFHIILAALGYLFQSFI